MALTFSTYPLVTHHQDADAKRSGQIYMGNIGFHFRLLSIEWCFGCLASYWNNGVVNGGILAGKIEADSWVVSFLLALFAFGTAKAALLPFHKWLPNAMVAPTPVSNSSSCSCCCKGWCIYHSQSCCLCIWA